MESYSYPVERPGENADCNLVLKEDYKEGLQRISKEEQSSELP